MDQAGDPSTGTPGRSGTLMRSRVMHTHRAFSLSRSMMGIADADRARNGTALGGDTNNIRSMWGEQTPGEP